MSILINDTQFNLLSGQIATTGQNLQNTVAFLSGMTGIIQTGIGTGGYIPRFVPNGSGINNSNIFYQASTSKLGINTSAPIANLDISGHFLARNISGQGLFIKIGGNSVIDATTTTPKFNKIDVGFGWYLLEQGSNGGLAFGSGHSINWKASTTSTANGGDVYLYRDNANHLGLRSGIGAPQSFNVYNTYADPLNFERGYIRWTGNNFELGNTIAGSGVNRGINIRSNSQINVISNTLETGISISGNTVKINNFAVVSGLVLSGTAPSTSTSIGISGQMVISGMFLYICTGNNLWGKVTIGGF